MLRKKLALMFIPLLITGAAFASPQAAGSGDSAAQATDAGKDLAVLQAVATWSIKLSELAEQRAESQLVKDYARTVATSNKASNAKIASIAQKHGLTMAPLDAKTEEGKSLQARMQAETVLLSSLQGDAFDKEYMTLVTNTQQSVKNFLDKSKASASQPDVKEFLDETTRVVDQRLKTAQAIMVDVYRDEI